MRNLRRALGTSPRRLRPIRRRRQHGRGAPRPVAEATLRRPPPTTATISRRPSARRSSPSKRRRRAARRGSGGPARMRSVRSASSSRRWLGPWQMLRHRVVRQMWRKTRAPGRRSGRAAAPRRSRLLPRRRHPLWRQRRRRRRRRHRRRCRPRRATRRFSACSQAWASRCRPRSCTDCTSPQAAACRRLSTSCWSGRATPHDLLIIQPA
mmetsp:Transcript_14781/g.38302  ORF Transcript_14781/g.38302 Transcript_14781/m.38302 type:complete len:209 (+) Transcript_14781:920-1546(+)